MELFCEHSYTESSLSLDGQIEPAHVKMVLIMANNELCLLFRTFAI